MDSDGLPMIGSGVDYSQVGAIHQKRTLAFINYFVTSTVSFLNNFSRSCEVRLKKCESKIQKLEASIEILEAKISSVPGLEDVSSTSANPTPIGPTDATPSHASTPISSVNEVADSSVHRETNKIPEGMILVKEHPIFKKYFRMLQVGVSEPAVKHKMVAEGLNPDMLSNPEQLVPATMDSSTHNESDKPSYLSESGSD